MSLSKAIAYFILTFGMLNLQLGPTIVELNYLQAQTSGSTGTTNTSTGSTNTASQNASNQAASAFDQAAASVNTETFKGEDAESMGSFMSILTMIIIGFLTMGFFVNCPEWSADMIVAAIGGGIYIMAEIMELFGEQAEIKSKSISYDVDGFGVIQDEEQKTALVEERKQYQSVKESAEKKAKYQKAASTAFYVSAGVALTFSLLETTAATTCFSLGTVEAAEGNAACGAAIAAVEEDQMMCFMTVQSAIDSAERKAKQAITTACGSCEFWTGVVIASTAACNPVAIVENNIMSKEIYTYNSNERQLLGLIDAAMYSNLKKLKKNDDEKDKEVLEEIFNIFFPKAEASMGTLLGGLGGGLVTAYVFKQLEWTVMDLFLGTPMKRAIVFAVLGMLAGNAANTSEGIADAMQRNIDKLDKIINRYDQFQNINEVKGTPGNANIASVPQNIQALGRIGTPENPFPCVVKNSQGKCVSTAAAFNNALPNKGLSFDPMTQAMIANATKVADGTSGRTNINDDAQSGINGLANGQNAMAKRVKKLQDAFNDARKKAKQKPVDFNNMGKKFLGASKAAIKKGLAKKGLTAKGVVSSISPSVNAIKDMKEDSKAGDDSTGVAMAGGAFQAGAGSSNGFKLNLGDDDKSAGAGAMPELPGLDMPEEDADIAAMDEEMAGQDIIQNKNADIFQAISVRYLKSYDKLFEEKKKEPEINE